MQPITYFLEPCVYPREGICEASAEVCTAGVNEHRNSCHLGRRDCHLSRRQHVCHRKGETAYRPTVSKTSWTYIRISSGPGRALSCPKRRVGTAQGRRKTLKPVMHGIEQSDGDIVAMKAANKGRPAESLEPRSPPKGKLGDPNSRHTQRWINELWGQSATAILPSCTGVQPKGGAGCVNAHVRICPGGPGKLGSLPVCQA